MRKFVQGENALDWYHIFHFWIGEHIYVQHFTVQATIYTLVAGLKEHFNDNPTCMDWADESKYMSWYY